MKIHPLKDGNFSVDKNKNFTYLEDSENEKDLKIAIQPFLVETKDDLVMLDAGLGWLENGVPKIHLNIEKAGLKPENVKRVLLSHLHKDHIDGLVNKDGEHWSLNFPEAEVYLQKRELEFARSKDGNPSFDLKVLNFIIDNAKIVWMDLDKGNLTPEISYEVTGGHTPFHQVFWIKENNETAFYGADNLPQMGYLKYQIAFKTDFDGKKARDERMLWEKQAREEQWKILLYHDLELDIVTI
ncbi:MBL fold metallo-hydrolase [Epilithonimonas lactis]|uniref:Beta-lactamase n=1 Tax=Epilithonimonas lactis TaxID=421072 RepID=A0A085BFQ1_9FLAO|nr:MBL fold metallo-hydrolase [Epilithonimonas lactis]KFC21296.1 beta-lactamase [Epilithonimonas lactis]SEP80188.1 Metallo-beta-lactamase superfamily protein [Epilithonimonas lactis]